MSSKKIYKVSYSKDTIDDIITQLIKEEKEKGKEKPDNDPFSEIKRNINSAYVSTSNLLQKYKRVNLGIDDCNSLKEIEELFAEENVEECTSLMDKVEYLIVSSDQEIVSNFFPFDQLKHNYYSIKSIKNECEEKILHFKLELLNGQINNLNKKAEETIDGVKKINKQYENIGSTILTIILSVTVVTTSLTAMTKLDVQYIPLFIVGITWFAMTIIVFISDLFKSKDYNSKQAKGLYVIISILLFGILLLNIFYNSSLHNPEKCTNVVRNDEESE